MENSYLKNIVIEPAQIQQISLSRKKRRVLPNWLGFYKEESRNPENFQMFQKHILMDISGFRDDVYLLASEIGQDLVKQANLTNRRDVQQLFSLFCMRQQLWDWYQSHPDEFQSLKLQEGEIITDLKRQKKF